MIEMLNWFIDRGDWSAVVWSLVGIVSVLVHLIGGFLYARGFK